MPHSHPKPSRDSQWLATSLADLLNTQHVVVADESPLLPSGPGAVDKFSTKFDEMFSPEARGFVDGQEVDRETLKETLLGLQRRWNSAEGTCVGCVAHPTHVVKFHVSVVRLLLRIQRNSMVSSAHNGGADRVYAIIQVS